MAKLERFEDLEVWQQARALAGRIYALARGAAFRRDYGFRDQICRAAVSIVSNIAEGFERHSSNQFLHFLDIAAGSAGEVRAQLYLALDFGYMDVPQFQAAMTDVDRVGQMLTKLKQYLRNHRPPSTIQRSNAPTIQRPNPPSPQRSNDPTPQRSNAPTPPPPNNPTIQRSNDPTSAPPNDPTIQRSNDSTIQRPNDPTIQRPNDSLP